MTTPPEAGIEEAAEQWRTDGWVLLERLVPGDEVAAALTELPRSEPSRSLEGQRSRNTHPDAPEVGAAFRDDQFSGTTLFPIREVIMNRLQYYKHGTFETLVGNFVVDVGQDQGGVRWFELRRDTPGQAWTTYQEGTWSIDADNRWMAGIAMDQSRNIALGYSVSSSARRVCWTV